MTRVRVIHGGFLTQVQDGGRWGYEHWGIPVNGHLDEFAAGWANWLLGNEAAAAVLEVTAAGPELAVMEEGLLAWTGASYPVHLDGHPWPSGQGRLVRRGSRIRFGFRQLGMRAYVAFPDGIDVPLVMGSRATDVAAGMGGYRGRQLRGGDEISSVGLGTTVRSTQRLTFRKKRVLRVLAGGRPERLAPVALTRLLTEEFRVARDSSAMGLRLLGGPLDHPRGDWPSEGMAIGAIECPPSGEPLVLLRNRGSIGGYPVVAHVIRADWSALGQLGPDDPVFFQLVDRTTAKRAVINQFAEIGRAGQPVVRSYPAPWDSVVRRRDAYGRVLADVGEWMEPGQPVLFLEALGQQVPLAMTSPGQLLEISPDGTGVAAGDILWTGSEEGAEA